MQGKVVGIYGFESKAKDGKPSKTWVKIYIQQDMPENGFGVRVENLLVSPDRLPMLQKDMVGKHFVISTNNNFASDFYCIEK